MTACSSFARLVPDVERLRRDEVRLDPRRERPELAAAPDEVAREAKAPQTEGADESGAKIDRRPPREEVRANRRRPRAIRRVPDALLEHPATVAAMGEEPLDELPELQRREFLPDAWQREEVGRVLAIGVPAEVQPLGGG